MVVKTIMYGVSSIIVLVLLISMLGAMNSILSGITSTLSGSTISMGGDYYCSKDSDCKQNPKDCSECINILSGGVTVLNKCRDEPRPCYCVNRVCSTSRA